MLGRAPFTYGQVRPEERDIREMGRVRFVMKRWAVVRDELAAGERPSNAGTLSVRSRARPQGPFGVDFGCSRFSAKATLAVGPTAAPRIVG